MKYNIEGKNNLENEVDHERRRLEVLISLIVFDRNIYHPAFAKILLKKSKISYKLRSLVYTKHPLKKLCTCLEILKREHSFKFKKRIRRK